MDPITLLLGLLILLILFWILRAIVGAILFIIACAVWFLCTVLSFLFGVRR